MIVCLALLTQATQDVWLERLTESWKNVTKDRYDGFLKEIQSVQKHFKWDDNVTVDDIATENWKGTPHAKVYIRITANDQHWTLTTELGLFPELRTEERREIRLMFSLQREPPNSREKTCWEMMKSCVYNCRGPWLEVGENYHLVDDILKPLSGIYDKTYFPYAQFVPCVNGISCVTYGIYVYEVLGLDDKMLRVGLTKWLGYTPCSPCALCMLGGCMFCDSYCVKGSVLVGWLSTHKYFSPSTI